MTPKTLYRFRRTGASLAYTLRELSGELWCAYAPTLNDPFDGLGKVSSETVDFLHRRPHDSSDIVRTVPFEKIWAVACFTETWASPTMWAHYADNYTGICLGYSHKKLRQLIDAQNRAALMKNMRGNLLHATVDLVKVDYQTPIPKSFTSIAEAIRTKTADWKYEREWRLTTQGILGKGGDATHGTTFYAKEAICEILIGVNTDKTTRSVLIHARNTLNPNILLKFAIPDKQTGGLKRIS